MNSVLNARDGYGGFQFEVLFRLMDLEELEKDIQIDCMKKAIIIERVIAEHHQNKSEEERNIREAKLRNKAR